MIRHPMYCTFFYLASISLGTVDGMIARGLGQTSRFGAVMDMIIERYASSEQVKKCWLKSTEDVRHPYSRAIYHLYIQAAMPSFSKFQSCSNSRVFICICIGKLKTTGSWMSSMTDVLFLSSLAKSTARHELAEDVMIWILVLYYQHPVSRPR